MNSLKRSPKIIVAEDDPHIAKLVMFKLSNEGYALDWVQNGHEVIQKLKSTNYDLIILDVMMPQMDGLETLQEIRQNDYAPSTPIIMMTAKGQERDIQDALESGATEYIVKPFDPQELALRVASVLTNAST